MSFALSAAAAKKVEELVRRYPRQDAALLPVLHIVQREKGFIPPEAEAWVSPLVMPAPSPIAKRL